MVPRNLRFTIYKLPFTLFRQSDKNTTITQKSGVAVYLFIHKLSALPGKNFKRTYNLPACYSSTCSILALYWLETGRILPARF